MGGGVETCLDPSPFSFAQVQEAQVGGVRRAAGAPRLSYCDVTRRRNLITRNWSLITRPQAMLTMRIAVAPPGVSKDTSSPAAWPSRARPTGDSLEMRPCVGAASSGPTI